jgi:hypothetical protein
VVPYNPSKVARICDWVVFQTGCIWIITEWDNQSDLVVFPNRLYFKPRETTLWVEPSLPSVTEGHDQGVCSEPVVFQTEGDNTLSWYGLIWTKSPQCYPGTWSGCVFRAGCVSNRGRQHFELIWFELNRVTPVLPKDMIRVCVPSRLCFKPRETTLWVDLVWVEPSHPRVTEGHDRGVCSEPVVFQTEGDNTLSWFGLSWTESPPVLPRDMIGFVVGVASLYGLL